MNVLDKAGLTKLCTKIKEKFATKSELGFYVGGGALATNLEIEQSNVNYVDINLNNANGSPNTITSIEAATTAFAGVMSATDKVKVDRLDYTAYANIGDFIYNQSTATFLEVRQIMNIDANNALYYIKIKCDDSPFTLYKLMDINEDYVIAMFPPLNQSSDGWTTGITIVLGKKQTGPMTMTLMNV